MNKLLILLIVPTLVFAIPFKSGKLDHFFGKGTAADISLFADDDSANKPYIRWDDGAGNWVFSNDGTTDDPIGAAGSPPFTIADFALANNVGAPTDVTGLVFSSASYKSVRVMITISRRTDTQNVEEVGHMFLVYDAEASDWRISIDTLLDDAGVVFTVTAAGQVQYTSTDLTGSSYSGTLKMSDIVRVDI